LLLFLHGGIVFLERKNMITLNQYKKFDKLTAVNDHEDYLPYRLENFGIKEYKMFFLGVNDWEIEDTNHEIVNGRDCDGTPYNN